MAFAVREKGGKVLYSKVKDLDSLVQEGMRQGWLEFMRDLKHEANRATLAKDKTGRIYTIRSPKTGRRRKHRASAPGQSHANMFGPLRKSLSYKLKGYDAAAFGYGADGKAQAPVYARAIEYGYKPRNLLPRPTLQNAVDNVDHVQAFDRGLARMLKGLVRR